MRRTNSGGKKKVYTIIIAAVLIISILSIYLGIQGNQCKKVLERFETSCSELNVKEMLNCINPTIADPIKLVVSLIPDNASEVLMDVMGELTSNATDLTGEDTTIDETFVASIKIKPRWYSVGFTKASLSCWLTFELNGVEVRRKVKISMIKRWGEWYIAGLKLVGTT